MSNRRMASSELFEDDFVGALDFFQRLVWIGLFVACADDQGRLIDNNSVIRSKVFLFDTSVDDQMVEKAVSILADAGKIVRYVSGNKRMIQIVEWWQYQTPSWASPSRFPAPEGWIDRAKYHSIGNKIEQVNWNLRGGFVNQPLHSALDSAKGSAIEERREEEGKRREVGEDVEVNPPPVGGDNDGNAWVGLEEIDQFEQLSGLTAPNPPHELFTKWIEALQRLKISGADKDIQLRAIQELTEKKYRIAGPWSIEKACAMILAERRRETIPKTRARDSEGEFAEHIRH